MKERDISLDFVRGIGMILVVLGHTVSVYQDFVYLFHVPLFFIVSGALFRRTDSLRNDLCKKWKRLYLPNLEYGILFLLLHNVFVGWGIYASEAFYEPVDFLKSATKVVCWGNEQLGGSMWFLRSLFFAYCLYLMYAYIPRKYFKMVFVLVVVGVGWYLSYTRMLFQIRTLFTIPCLIFPFVLIGGGKICKHIDGLMEKFKYSFVAFLLVSGIALFFVSRYVSIDLAHLRLPNPLLYYVAAVIGLIFVLSINRLLQGSWLQRVIVYVGNHSVPILALHFLTFKLVTFALNSCCGYDFLVSDFPMPLLPDKALLPLLYTVVGVGLPLLCNMIYNYLKHIIFSKR